MIKVLVVDDSPTARELLCHLLGTDPEVRVVGAAKDGHEAIQYLRLQRPDVITMDIHMPGMNGLEATRTIMETQPVPIVIVSGNWEPGEVETTFHAMESGALAIVQRPKGIGHPDHSRTTKELIQTVKLMSEIKVVRRRVRERQAAERWTAPGAASYIAPADVTAVAIGASTGGPLVIQSILKGLPRDFPASIFVVQHVAEGFLKGMVDWLSETSAVPLVIAGNGEPIAPGRAYFAPDGHNMGLGADCRIRLVRQPARDAPGASVGYLFRSVAEALGPKAVGILLTGMGRDGAEELRLMRERGALTIAQDKESSVVFGMPAAAIELQAATYVLSPEKILAVLQNMAARMTRPAITEDAAPSRSPEGR